MPSPIESPHPSNRLVGRAVERVEDAALLTGRGRFADDLGERPGTAHAAVLRSPLAHAEIVSLDAADALAMPEVVTVLTGKDVAAWSRPFIAGVKQPMRHHALAVERVRYVGEPVAVAVARDRYAAEDALERIEVEYRELDPVVDPVVAATAGAPLLHPELESNVVSDRRFRYGDPDTAFADAEHRIGISVRYPRNACTPIEGFVVVAEHLGDDGYDVLSNFQGPFSLHPVMARALGIPGSRLRLRSPRDSGGSFGVKQAIFPYVVAMCLASRKARCPVKWVEDRLEHLVAATSATNRVTALEAAVGGDGTIAGLRWDQLDDCGAYLRAPEPASLYRTHGHMTGPYRIAHLEIRNRVVLTDKTPTGLNRGFGGPQVYFALERLVHRIAKTLGLDPLDVIRRNLVPRDAFSVPGRLRLAARLRRLCGRAGRRRRRRTPRPAPGAARRRPRRGTPLRHRVRGRGRAEHLQHGLHHHGADRGGARAGGAEGRRGGKRDDRDRSDRIDRGARRVGAAGPGPPDGPRPGRRRRAGGGARRRHGERGARHPEGPVVDRGRELLQPLLRRGRGGPRTSRP